MEKEAIIEIIAIVMGLVVVSIETVIIVLLQKHLRALDTHICKLEKGMSEHLEHLNEHSHAIENALEKICGPVPTFNSGREHQSTTNRQPEKQPQKSPDPVL